MKFFEKIGDAILRMWERFKPQDDGSGSKFRIVCLWLFKFRSIFLAIPVIIATVVLASANMARLPESLLVKLPGFTSSGHLILDTFLLEKPAAVFIPVVLTSICVVMMFFSRRVVYPWICSILTLILPLFLYFITIFPG